MFLPFYWERSGPYIGLGNEGYYLDSGLLDHETKIRMNQGAQVAVKFGTYDEAFEAIEIFLELVKVKLYQQTYEETLRDVALAFRSAGSVYKVNTNNQIVLQVSTETAKNIEGTERELAARSPEALDFFRRALSDLLARKRGANDIVKDFAVAMEDYLKAIAGKKDFGEALRELRTKGIIAATQQGVLEKLYAYRGDAHGVAHSGNTEEPNEVDAVWFLETFIAQIKMIEAKLTSKTSRAKTP